MKKFITTVDIICPPEFQAFYKAIYFLQCYANTCEYGRAFIPGDIDEVRLFKNTITGLSRDVGILWNRYVYEICQTTAERLLNLKLFKNESEFYQIMNDPHNQTQKDLLEKIFDEMAEVIKEKHAALGEK